MVSHNIIYPLSSVQNILKVIYEKKIWALNTITKYFHQRIIEGNYNVDQYCNSLIWPSNFYAWGAKPEAVTQKSLCS